MKFLTFTDLHEDRKVLKELVKRAQEDDVDFLVTAGDLTEFGKSLRFVLKQLNSIGKLVYIIPGNHESDNMLNPVLADYPNCINFNKKVIKLGDYYLMGYGGGGFAVEDPGFRKVSREWYSKYQDKKTILVTHGPPFGTKVDLLQKRHVGSKDFRKFIDRIKPKLVLCGHLHETVGVLDEVGPIKILNPGWEGMVVELN